MLSALIGLIVLAGSPAPVLPAGTNADFQQLYGSIMSASAKSDFKTAERLSKLLPKENIVIQWDDSKVPGYLKAEFTDARQRALAQWAKYLPNFSFSIGPKPDIKFSFEPSLPAKDGNLAPGAIHFFGVSPEDPRLEVVISLERGKPPLPSEATDIHNEVGYALSQYIGIARTPTFGGYATRADVPTGILVRPLPTEMNLSKILLDISKAVRASIQKKDSLTWSIPKASIDKEVFDLGTVKQGEVKRFSYGITNIGQGQLSVRMIPDCGCVALSSVPSLDQGQTRLVQMAVDSSDFIGEQHKGIMLYTNDPEHPVRELKVKLNIIPAYRLIVPDGENINMDFKGGAREIYLTVPEGSDLVPKDFRLDGLPAKVNMQPWSGDLADLELNEPAKPRKGYKFTVEIEPGVYIGRNNATLVVTTTSQKFPVLRLGLSVQNGIVAMPEKLNLYQIPRGPKRVSFLVSRPNQDFEITKVVSDSPYLTFSYTPVRGKWEYKVTVQYDGKSPDVQVNGSIKVWTDDPRYSVITVPFAATQK